jgi:hypothetical protein
VLSYQEAPPFETTTFRVRNSSPARVFGVSTAKPGWVQRATERMEMAKEALWREYGVVRYKANANLFKDGGSGSGGGGGGGSGKEQRAEGGGGTNGHVSGEETAGTSSDLSATSALSFPPGLLASGLTAAAPSPLGWLLPGLLAPKLLASAAAEGRPTQPAHTPRASSSATVTSASASPSSRVRVHPLRLGEWCLNGTREVLTARAEADSVWCCPMHCGKAYCGERELRKACPSRAVTRTPALAECCPKYLVATEKPRRVCTGPADVACGIALTDFGSAARVKPRAATVGAALAETGKKSLGGGGKVGNGKLNGGKASAGGTRAAAKIRAASGIEMSGKARGDFVPKAAREHSVSDLVSAVERTLG